MIEHNYKIISDLKKLIQDSLEDGKARDVVTIDLSGKTDIADYMIIASGTSSRHNSSLAQNLIKKIQEIDPSRIAVEGIAVGDWILVDIGGDIIVHIFKPDVREHYNLEKMWSVPVPELHVVN